VSQTDREAASFIHAFWRDLWNNTQTANPSGGGEQSASELLAQHFPVSNITWTQPSFWELLAQIRKCHGSAGLDSFGAVTKFVTYQKKQLKSFTH